ncbi:MAG: nucleotidyltransferase domain-containing protein [Gemmatimonadota bacterium]
MLLLGPDTRRAILARVFLDPSREYHLRELVRLTGFALRSVQREVERLVGADLLTERRSGNRRYLRANDRHPLFQPIRDIVLKTEGLADVLRESLGTRGIDFALVFGSIASHHATAGSDVDLLIVGSLGLREAVRRLGPAHDRLGREINPVVWSRDEFERRRGRSDPFLRRLLEGPVVRVIGEPRALTDEP